MRTLQRLEAAGLLLDRRDAPFQRGGEREALLLGEAAEEKQHVVPGEEVAFW